MPLRTLALVVATAPVALACLGISALSVSSRVGLALAVLMLGFTLAAPMREGIWIGTWYLYRLARRVLPTTVLDGSGRRARVRLVGGGLEVADIRDPITVSGPLRALRHLTRLPTVDGADAGVIQLNPGG